MWETLYTRSVFSISSRLAELGYPNARVQLKDDAVPDVEWPNEDKCSTSSNMQLKQITCF